MELTLDPAALMTAYANGIFPMAEDDGTIMWFSPDPRAVIDLDDFHASGTLRQLCRQERFEVCLDRDFVTVMRECARRPEGTWISEQIIEAYCRLHALGYAHSIEAYHQGELAGGLYGVAVGGVFCGESMFHRQRDASKVALVYLVDRLAERGFCLLDIQFMTEHLKQFGAQEIPQSDYLQRLGEALKLTCRLRD